MTTLRTFPNVLGKQLATVLIASSDQSFRQKIQEVLQGLRWRVVQAAGGAEALLYLNSNECTAIILDSWLPDLEVSEVISECRRRYPGTDLLMQGMNILELDTVKNSRRQELWYALRCGYAEGADLKGEGSDATPSGNCRSLISSPAGKASSEASRSQIESPAEPAATPDSGTRRESSFMPETPCALPEKRQDLSAKLPELVGSSAAIIDLCRQIRLVAPKKTSVLIQGPTGTGKELVARAVHRLSRRSQNPFIVLNCAAIPEALLEAELFGHTKGAFTGAIHSRLGRLEAAHGGTLFLDEIGEMPLMLQAKLLRFLEAGELQRIGENEPVRVDVRVIAATHQPLEQRTAEGSFRTDLYFRLAVFPLVTPSLAERQADIPELVAHFMRRFATDQPAKSVHPSGLERLLGHTWPGGVRELEHVLERGYILAEERPAITAAEIRFGSSR